jgi:predicted RNase H-like nuclease (RuvC/YqgF family)
MLKEISKKLTMKKTFFVTQLESFFNSITQEYQEIINSKDVEISIMQEKLNKQEIDIKNLVEIKNSLQKSEDIYKKQIKSLQDEVTKLRQSSDNSYNQNLENENRELKKQIRSKDDSTEIQSLKQKIKQLQNIIAKGATAYNDNLANQNSEKLIQEISQSLKK